jgi:hypothetical protein
MGVISTVVGVSPRAGVRASIDVLGALFRTREVQKVLACIASEEEALQRTVGPELLFGYRLAKRHIRDAIVAQSAEITDKIRNAAASPRGMFYKTVKEVCEADLGSGSMHCGRGELSMHGKALLALCARACKELETEGMRSRDATFREMERLRLEIARAG